MFVEVHTQHHMVVFTRQVKSMSILSIESDSVFFFFWGGGGGLAMGLGKGVKRGYMGRDAAQVN